MADNAHDTAHDKSHGGSQAAAHANHADGGDHGEHAEHPGWSIYWKVALILTIITAVEVSAFYIPAWETSWIYVPSMLIMSTVKFVIVVMFYMHLKYDHKLFRSLFTGPLIIAGLTLVGLLFLFGQLSVRLGLLS